MSEVRHPRGADMVWLCVFRNGQAAQKMQREMLGVFGLQIAEAFALSARVTL